MRHECDRCMAISDAAHPRAGRQRGRTTELNYSVYKQPMEPAWEGDLMGVNTIMDLHAHFKITDCDTDTMAMLSSHLHSDLTSRILIRN